jgi:glutamyl-tRNA reductase
LVKHTKTTHHINNRTKDKAERLAGKSYCKDYSELHLDFKSRRSSCTTGAQNPTVDKAILNLKKPLLILDLSIPKMYMLMLKEEGVTLIHMDYLSQLQMKL